MANWKTTIKIGDLHSCFEANQMPLPELGHQLAYRIKQNRFYSIDNELGSIVLELNALDDDEDYYDELLEQLYDFGDQGHRIWVDPCDKSRP